jgi:chromosomal replication initiator protein
MTNAWQHLLEHLGRSGSISPQTHETWIEPLRFLRQEVETGSDGINIHLLAPDAYFAEWIKDHISDVLTRAYKDATGEEANFHFSYPTLLDSKKETRAVPTPDLNPNFTFERFVPGDANQEAYTAAQSVAKKPAESFNPLYIAGGIGLGKTHLVQAIGHHLVKTKPSSVIRYISGERYVNSLITALRSRDNSKIEAFRNQFRSDCDILLIDDIHFISGKTKTQDEFFHTFNDLYHTGKQIVMSGNQLPADIPDLNERLRSRLQWNLVVEIKPPALPLRLAILKDKAERMGMRLSDEVAHHVAEHVDTNVRNLESVLANIHFRCSMLSSEATIPIADKVLKELFRVAEKPPITPEMILSAVARQAGMQIRQLKGTSRDRGTVSARQMAMYLCRRHTGMSAPSLASFFEINSHATVLNAAKKIKQELAVNANTKKQLEMVSQVIEQLRREN